MKSGESIEIYFSRVMEIVNKKQMYGNNLEDITIIEKILRSLTPKFNFVVCIIEESKDIDEISLNELQSFLIVHEQKIKQQDLNASIGNHLMFKGGKGRSKEKRSNDQWNQQQQQQQQKRESQSQ